MGWGGGVGVGNSLWIVDPGLVVWKSLVVCSPGGEGGGPGVLCVDSSDTRSNVNAALGHLTTKLRITQVVWRV